MFHLHAALDHGAYSCRQRHQLKSRAVLAVLTRGVEAFLLSHLSGVALLQTEDVSSGRSGLFVKYRRAPIPDQGRQQYRLPRASTSAVCGL